MIASTNPSQIFVMSLPRSGSTMLQRLLGSHANITAISEPGLILPLVYMLRPDGIRAEYGHRLIHHGIMNLLSNVEDGKAAYYSGVNRFVSSLYAKAASPDARYVLDKTPRYYLIGEGIAEAFPDAKLIFLFRNPLDVLTSYISHLRGNRLRRWDHSEQDLGAGPALLASSCRDLRERSLVVRYEQLVADPAESLRRILHYLDLDAQDSTADAMIREFARQRVPSGLGDAAGCRTYTGIEDQSGKWKQALNTRARKRLARRFIQAIDEEYLSLGGYSRTRLLDEIDSVRPSRIGIQDTCFLAQSALIKLIKRPIGWQTLG